jgi:hypothetical protein
MVALDRRHKDTVRLLLQSGCAIDTSDKSGNTPLLIVVDHCDIDMVELLLRSGLSFVEEPKMVNTPDKYGFTPLMVAIDYHRTDIVELLLQFGAMTLNKEKLSPLYQAINLWLRDKDSEIAYLINVLLAVGFDHTYRDYDRYINIIRTFSEQEVCEARYRVFFSRSMCNRLLVATANTTNGLLMNG